jgi:hypothetical protein
MSSGYTLLSELVATSHKRRTCISCRLPIQRGEKFVCERSEFNGCPQEFSWHIECAESSLPHGVQGRATEGGNDGT